MTDDLETVARRIVELGSKATPGPWEWIIHDHSMASLGIPPDPGLGNPLVLAVSPCKGCQDRAESKEWKWGRCCTPSEADAAFIAFARNHAPALAADWLRLREALEPFAKFAEAHDGADGLKPDLGENYVWLCPSPGYPKITTADFRRARAALEQTNNGGGRMISERRYDEGSEIREMARADGYVMARRPGCMPFVISAKEWDAMPRAALAPAEKPIPSVIDEIAAERRRQIEVEGWSPEHDDEHDEDQLAKAAIVYAAPDWLRQFFDANDIRIWPWDADWWRPNGRRRDLIRAAALIVAEIERLDRASNFGAILDAMEERDRTCRSKPAP
jgi:hypothetical protein